MNLASFKTSTDYLDIDKSFLGAFSLGLFYLKISFIDNVYYKFNFLGNIFLIIASLLILLSIACEIISKRKILQIIINLLLILLGLILFNNFFKNDIVFKIENILIGEYIFYIFVDFFRNIIDLKQNSNTTKQNSNTTKQNSDTTKQNSDTTKQNSDTTNETKIEKIIFNLYSFKDIIFVLSALILMISIIIKFYDKEIKFTRFSEIYEGVYLLFSFLLLNSWINENEKIEE